MPHRAIYIGTILIGLVGLVLLAALWLARRDARAAAGRGPRWKRALLAAAFALLGMSTMVASGQQPPEPRPPDIEGPTCYMPPFEPPAQPQDLDMRLKRLNDRVILLANLTREQKLQSEAINTTIATIERDLADLAALQGLTDEQRKNVDARVVDARNRVARARAMLAVGGQRELADTEQWKSVAATWAAAAEIAAGKKGDYPFDEAGKEKLRTDIRQAKAHVDTLWLADLLTLPEAGLMTAGLDRLDRKVNAFRTTEEQGWTCYLMIYNPPARDSMQRLEARLPLLEKLTLQKKINAKVTDRVLASIEGDVATLDDPKAKEGLSESERARAEALHTQAKAQVERVKAILAGRPVPPPAPVAGRFYEVQQGDTLWYIAEQFLGRGARWQEIVDANPGLNPSALRIGQVIKLPPAAATQPDEQ